MSKKNSTTNPFIVIEALDAGGSQTQTNLLVRRFKKEKYNVLPLHFPHEDRDTGRFIYNKFLLNHNKHPFSKREQSLIYIQDFYSRNEDIAAVLKQKRGRHAVVSDRYCTSTFAYQTAGLTGSAYQRMYSWIEWLCYGDTPTLHTPDLVIFIDTPVDIALNRLANKTKDYHENKQKLTKFRNSYLRVAETQKWYVTSGVTPEGKERTRPDLAREIWQAVIDRLNLPHG
jgi:dTMP kinase